MPLSDPDQQTVGDCPLCARPLVAGGTINEHHLTPKSYKGKETITLHKICHSKIHSVFTEKELHDHYHTIDRLLEHPEIENFVKWVRKKDPEFMDRNRATKTKRGKRKYK